MARSVKRVENVYWQGVPRGYRNGAEEDIVVAVSDSGKWEASVRQLIIFLI